MEENDKLGALSPSILFLEVFGWDVLEGSISGPARQIQMPRCAQLTPWIPPQYHPGALDVAAWPKGKHKRETKWGSQEEETSSCHADL